MNLSETALEITDTLLGYLGFVVHLENTGTEENPSFQIFTEDSDLLIGRDGERLEDIQYLVNRLLQARAPQAPRVRIDIAHYRSMQEDQMLEHVRRLADRVRHTGRPAKLPPMNSYQRRLVHNAFKDDPDVKTWSPEDKGRLKRITLIRRPRGQDAV
jgi:spoIIIJ-associated protein